MRVVPSILINEIAYWWPAVLPGSVRTWFQMVDWMAQTNRHPGVQLSSSLELDHNSYNVQKSAHHQAHWLDIKLLNTWAPVLGFRGFLQSSMLNEYSAYPMHKGCYLHVLVVIYWLMYKNWLLKYEPFAARTGGGITEKLFYSLGLWVNERHQLHGDSKNSKTAGPWSWK